MIEKEVKVIKVSASTPVTSLTGSILNVLRTGKETVELRAIGAGATSQMYKALAKTNSAVAVRGISLFVKPGFDTVYEEVDGEQKEKTVVVARIVLM